MIFYSLFKSKSCYDFRTDLVYEIKTKCIKNNIRNILLTEKKLNIIYNTKLEYYFSVSSTEVKKQFENELKRFQLNVIFQILFNHKPKNPMNIKEINRYYNLTFKKKKNEKQYIYRLMHTNFIVNKNQYDKFCNSIL